MSKHREIAKRLEGKLTATECGQLILEAQSALVELDTEIGPLHPGDMSHRRGEERKRILLSGSPEDVLDLRDKFDILQAQHDQLKALIDELRQRRQTAAVREASDGLPALHDLLRRKIAAAEKAQQALEAAFDDMEVTYLEITQAHATCNAGGLTGAGTTPETIDRLMRLAPLSGKDRHSTYPDAHRHGERLRIDREASVRGRVAA